MFIRSKILLITVISCIFITGCQEDLFPSNDQLTMESLAEVGSTLEFDLNFEFSTGETENLNQQLENHDLVVLYFTMWCPVCDSHMSHIRQNFVNQYQNVKFILVDYVSGSISSSRGAQLASGYEDLIVVSDYSGELKARLNGTMATTLVIDQNLVIHMNEDFKTGSRLKSVLDTLTK
jgi:peroxiredoxin